MKVIDFRLMFNDESRKISPNYFGAPLPFYIYHSTEEFEFNVSKPYLLINNILEFQEFILGNGYNNVKEFIYLYDSNIWFSTGERIVPDIIDNEDNIKYKLNDNGDVILTDDCYVRLVGLQMANYNVILYLTSGIWNTSLTKFKISAANKLQYLKTKTYNPKNTKMTHEEKFEYLLKKKQKTYRDMQVISLMMNPLSDTFLDANKCFAKIYPDFRKSERQRYMNSDKFKELFITQLGKLMPDLVKGVVDHNSPDDIGAYIKQMRKLALEKGSTEDQIQALNVTLKLGYSDQIIHSNNDLTQLANNKFVPLIGSNVVPLANSMNAPLAPVSEDIQSENEGSESPESSNAVEAYDDSDINDIDLESQEGWNKAMEETGGFNEYVVADEKPKPAPKK